MGITVGPRFSRILRGVIRGQDVGMSLLREHVARTPSSINRGDRKQRGDEEHMMLLERRIS
jgi:hypothetical protein